jgi:hypothetical protein
MIGRSGDRRATSRKPAAAKVDAYPVLVALGETSPSSGYASIADTPAERARSTAAWISKAVIPCRQFLATYERASGHSWTDPDIQAAWAAGLWTRAFDAKKASLAGADPAATFTKTEAKERAPLAGLWPHAALKEIGSN